MKKLIHIALIPIMILSALALTACGGGSKDLSDSKFVGTWKAAEIAVGEESSELGDDYILTVNGDGTGTLSGEGEESSFTWTPAGDGFRTKGDIKAAFKEDGDNLVTNVIGADLIFEKQ